MLYTPCNQLTCIETMPSDPSQPLPALWTIGHSNHPLEVFLDLLNRHGIELVADVRSSPYSRYASQFNREPLQAAIRDQGIKYRYYGDRLGGRVDDPSCYDEAGHVLYGRIATVSLGFR